jgi:hypothetical protein
VRYITTLSVVQGMNDEVENIREEGLIEASSRNLSGDTKGKPWKPQRKKTVTGRDSKKNLLNTNHERLPQL